VYYYIVDLDPRNNRDINRPHFLDPITDEDFNRLCAYGNERFRVADDDVATLRRQLPEVAPRSGADDCAICLRKLVVDPRSPKEEKATPRPMPCRHAFHEGSFFRWIREKRECPLCRRPLPTPRLPQQQDYDYRDDGRLQLTMSVPQEVLQIEVLYKFETNLRFVSVICVVQDD
jgi:hypothetical protein